ncbi:MAG TPA: hypothetical protein VKR61_00350 [Bryobacteraceae bacterium]|nr:hypothetical protein [Bryobacteraceae bacterium]
MPSIRTMAFPGALVAATSLATAATMAYVPHCCNGNSSGVAFELDAR